jgi:hypothetical protein
MTSNADAAVEDGVPGACDRPNLLLLGVLVWDRSPAEICQGVLSHWAEIRGPRVPELAAIEAAFAPAREFI